MRLVFSGVAAASFSASIFAVCASSPSGRVTSSITSNAARICFLAESRSRHSSSSTGTMDALASPFQLVATTRRPFRKVPLVVVLVLPSASCCGCSLLSSTAIADDDADDDDDDDDEEDEDEAEAEEEDEHSHGRPLE